MKKLKTERRPDYVKVRLSAAGEKLAAGALRVTNRHLDYAFKPGDVVEVVERYEWAQVLSRMTAPDGSALFELAEDKPEEEGVNANGGV